MKYFEGVIEYYYRYQEPFSKSRKRLYYKEGNYKEQTMLGVKEAIRKLSWEEIQPFPEKVSYHIHYNKKQVVVYNDSNKASDSFTESYEIKHLGNEQILGYDCAVVEVIETNRREGDCDTWQLHFRQWIANDLLLEPKFRREDNHYFSYKNLPTYAVVLKHEEIREEGKPIVTSIAKNIIAGEVDPSVFSLDNYQAFEQIDSNEEERRERLAQEKYRQEQMKRDEQDREELKKMLERELTPDEHRRPIHYLITIPLIKDLTIKLGRPLTKEEQDDPFEVCAQLQEEERRQRFIQKLLKKDKPD